MQEEKREKYRRKKCGIQDGEEGKESDRKGKKRLGGQEGEVGDVRNDGRERRGRRREEVGGGEKGVEKGEEDRAEKGR